MAAEGTKEEFIRETLAGPRPLAAEILAEAILDAHPQCAILLYGSGMNVSGDADVQEVVFDFYVIAPSYRQFYNSRHLLLFNLILPPNVFYIETPSSLGTLRAKYAVLSIGHFEKLVGRGTFHSYFWSRFAQPCRIMQAPAELHSRITQGVMTAVETFLARVRPLAPPQASIAGIWQTGLEYCYRAELRAESAERPTQLLERYGEWPERVSRNLVYEVPVGRIRGSVSKAAWQLRRFQGAGLSVLRLLKGTLTFQGGVDYIVWKISRHAGVAIPVNDWERRYPLLGAPFLARRYYRLRKGQVR